MSEASVQVDLRHRVGVLQLEAKLDLTAPWTVLFGPSGSGKSTLLKLICGLVRPDLGRIELRRHIVADTAAGVWTPAHLRPVRWAGQQDALFPHQRVRANLRSGMAPESVAELERAVDHFDLGGFASLMPAQLSGGQRRRVSVVRAAIGARGRVLLLDEPFSGLDARVRTRLIAQLREWVGETPVISVTHDVGEAFELGAEVVRLGEGKVIAQGPVGVVLGEERLRLRSVLGDQVEGHLRLTP